MNKLKILLLCSSRFALPVMRELVYAGLLAGVVIPENRKEIIEEVSQLLGPFGIKVTTVTKENNDNTIKHSIASLSVDLVFMVSYTYKISKEVYEMPEKGFFNFHSGPLPEYRGADPVFMQILNREKLAGVTAHKLSADYDTGDIVIKEMIRLSPEYTYGMLSDKLAELAAQLAGTILKMMMLDIPLPSVAQDESKAKYYKKQFAKDIVIRWDTMSADEIIALINACNPWNKGAVTAAGNKIIRILEATKKSAQQQLTVLPGTVLAIDSHVITVSTLHNESIEISFVYTDEGFLSARKFALSGLRAGTMFTTPAF